MNAFFFRLASLLMAMVTQAWSYRVVDNLDGTSAVMVCMTSLEKADYSSWMGVVLVN